MTEIETGATGYSSSERLIAGLREEHPELADLVPAGCIDCSSGWMMALHGQQERLDACPGQIDKIETIMGKVITRTLCRLPHGRVVKDSANG
jgi:hypothetical protein